MKKSLKIIGIILCILLFLFLLGYSKTVGFTKKQKYNNCAQVCEKMMLNESNIPLCKMKCENVTDYSPTKPKVEKHLSTPPKTTTPKTDTTTTNPTIDPRDEVTAPQSDPQSEEYYCEWTWPQVIIKRDTKERVLQCPSSKPWCYYGNKTYEDMACCEQYDKESDTKLNCTPLSELLNQ